MSKSAFLSSFFWPLFRPLRTNHTVASVEPPKGSTDSFEGKNPLAEGKQREARCSGQGTNKGKSITAYS